MTGGGNRDGARDGARDGNRDRRFASTLARGLAVLQAFRPSDDGLGNLEISTRTGIPRPTICRLTHTLCADGYLTQGRRNDKYRLGPAALALGQIAAAAFPFVDAAAPVMQALARRTGALIGIAIQDADHMLMCRTWAPDNRSRHWMQAGYRMPIATSSSGRAWLGALPQERLEPLAGEWDGEQRADLAELRRQAAAELVRQGYVCVSGEARYSPNVHAVAVPFTPPGMGLPVAFFAGASAREMPLERMHETLGPALVAAVSSVDTTAPVPPVPPIPPVGRGE